MIRWRQDGVWVYWECACPDWIFAKAPRWARSCEHLKGFLGEAYKTARVRVMNVSWSYDVVVASKLIRRPRTLPSATERVSASPPCSTGPSFHSACTELIINQLAQDAHRADSRPVYRLPGEGKGTSCAGKNGSGALQWHVSPAADVFTIDCSRMLCSSFSCFPVPDQNSSLS